MNPLVVLTYKETKNAADKMENLVVIALKVER